MPGNEVIRPQTCREPRPQRKCAGEYGFGGVLCLYAHPVGGDVPDSHFASPPRCAGEEGMFFRDVLRVYDKHSTALKTDRPSPGAGETIERREPLRY